MKIEKKKQLKARIIEVQKERYRVSYEWEEGRQEKHARLKGSAFYYNAKPAETGRESMAASYPVVGDYVMLQHNEQGDDVIEEILPRHSWFSRPNPATARQTEQGIAANFDVILLVQSFNQNFNSRRMERYLAAAWSSGATPVVVLTKADLVTKEIQQECVRQMEEVAIGVTVLAVSAISGDGMEALTALLEQGFGESGRTFLLVGSSGIGKSTLINALAGENVMETSEIRERDGRGRHTTTHRQMILLPNGALLIDTPGMRELGVWDAEDGVEETFADVEELAGQCRFRNCRHDREQGCAVKLAVQEGRLAAERFKSWQKLQREAAHQAKKLARKEAARRRR